jgi:hypothetical protein
VSFVQKYLDYFQKSVATSEASKNDIENQTQKGTVLRRSCSLSFIKYIAKVNTCGSTIIDIRPPPGGRQVCYNTKCNTSQITDETIEY